MTSLARRLVVYFVLLAVVPLVVGFLGLTAVIKRSEQRRIDEGLQASLRSATATYDGELLDAQRSAERLAKTAVFQRALLRRDRATLAGFIAASPHLRLNSGRLQIGKVPAYATERRVEIVGTEGPLGELIAAIPLSSSYLDHLAIVAGIPSNEKLVLAHGDRVLRSATLSSGRAELSESGAGIGSVRLNGKDYRIAVSHPVTTRGSIEVAIATPESRALHAAFLTEERLLLPLLALIVLMGTIAFLEGRGIVRNVGALATAARAIARGHLDERVPVHGRDEFASLAVIFNEMAEQLEERMKDLELERGRLREATLRFGEGLGASHDAVREGEGEKRVVAQGWSRAAGNADPHRRRVRRRRAGDGRTPLRARRGGARQCTSAPDRREAGARGRPDRTGEPPAYRFGAGRGDRSRLAPGE